MSEAMYQFYFILDERNNSIPELDAIKWARWMEDARKSRRTVVGQQTFKIRGHEMLVSTVFLGANHNFLRDEEEPILYETMVLGNEDIIKELAKMSEQVESSIIAMFTGTIDIQRRYNSRTAAIKGHDQMVHFVEVCSVQLNLSQEV